MRMGALAGAAVAEVLGAVIAGRRTRRRHTTLRRHLAGTDPASASTVQAVPSSSAVKTHAPSTGSQASSVQALSSSQTTSSQTPVTSPHCTSSKPSANSNPNKIPWARPTSPGGGTWPPKRVHISASGVPTTTPRNHPPRLRWRTKEVRGSAFQRRNCGIRNCLLCRLCYLTGSQLVS